MGIEISTNGNVQHHQCVWYLFFTKTKLNTSMQLVILWSWCRLKKITSSQDLPHHLDSMPNTTHCSYMVPCPFGIHRFTFLYSALLPSPLSSWFFLLLDLHSHFLSHQTVSLWGQRLDCTDCIPKPSFPTWKLRSSWEPLSLLDRLGGVCCGGLSFGLAQGRQRERPWWCPKQLLSPLPTESHLKKEESFHPWGKINCEDDGKGHFERKFQHGKL